MTALVSVRISDELFKAIKIKAKMLHVSQTEYIRQSIEKMNKAIEDQEKKKHLQEVSLRVRKESIKVNIEFDEIEYESND